MARFKLRVNNKPLEVGWMAKLVAEFEPISGCGEEAFWVRVESVNDSGSGGRYQGVVVDYLTYTRAHGMTQGFMMEFDQEHISEIWEPGQPRPTTTGRPHPPA